MNIYVYHEDSTESRELRIFWCTAQLVALYYILIVFAWQLVVCSIVFVLELLDISSVCSTLDEKSSFKGRE